MVRIPASPQPLFPEPDHSLEHDAQTAFSQLRDSPVDPWDYPLGTYPDFLPKFLYDAYDRIRNPRVRASVDGDDVQEHQHAHDEENPDDDPHPVGHSDS